MRLPATRVHAVLLLIDGLDPDDTVVAPRTRAPFEPTEPVHELLLLHVVVKALDLHGTARVPTVLEADPKHRDGLQDTLHQI